MQPTAAQLQRRETLRPHPVRDEILSVLRIYGQPMSIGQIVRITGRSLNDIAHHMRNLEAVGAVEITDAATYTRSGHLYALTTGEPLAPAIDPVNMALALSDSLVVPGTDGGLPRLTRLDDRGRAELEGFLKAMTSEVRRMALEATDRVEHAEARRAGA